MHWRGTQNGLSIASQFSSAFISRAQVNLGLSIDHDTLDAINDHRIEKKKTVHSCKNFCFDTYVPLASGKNLSALFVEISNCLNGVGSKMRLLAPEPACPFALPFF